MKARADLTALEAMEADRQARMQALRRQIEVLEEVLGTRTGTDVEPNTPSTEADWASIPRTDAVVRMLSERGAMSPNEIAKALNAVGRQDATWQNISRVLDHLRNKGRVKSLGRGQWVTAATTKLTLAAGP